MGKQCPQRELETKTSVGCEKMTAFNSLVRHCPDQKLQIGTEGGAPESRGNGSDVSYRP